MTYLTREHSSGKMSSLVSRVQEGGSVATLWRGAQRVEEDLGRGQEAGDWMQTCSPLAPPCFSIEDTFTLC